MLHVSCTLFPPCLWSTSDFFLAGHNTRWRTRISKFTSRICFIICLTQFQDMTRNLLLVPQMELTTTFLLEIRSFYPLQILLRFWTSFSQGQFLPLVPLNRIITSHFYPPQLRFSRRQSLRTVPSNRTFFKEGLTLLCSVQQAPRPLIRPK